MVGKDGITNEELKNLLEDLMQKIESGEIEQAKSELRQVLTDLDTVSYYIDRTYLSRIREEQRLTKTAQIISMLKDMDSEQINNVHVYVSNEHDEPNHEAVALDAIIRLSREQKPADE